MAKKVEDLQKYWQEIATKAGLDPDTTTAIANALGQESVAKAIRQGFVPVPEYHSQLDEVRREADGRKAELDKWYQEQALPAYQTNLSGIERLRQYESVYGPLEPGDTTRTEALDLGFKSKAELDRYLDDRLRSQQSGFVGLAKSIPKMTVDYLHQFGEVLDVDEVEKIAVKEGLPPDLAYQRYIAPKVEAKRQAEFEAKIKAAKDEGFKEAQSKYHLPVDSTPKESSPFWDRTAQAEAKPIDEASQDRHSRQSFLDGWNNYAETQANKNRPS